MEKLITGRYRIYSFTDAGKELMMYLGDLIAPSEEKEQMSLA